MWRCAFGRKGSRFIKLKKNFRLLFLSSSLVCCVCVCVFFLNCLFSFIINFNQCVSLSFNATNKHNSWSLLQPKTDYNTLKIYNFSKLILTCLNRRQTLFIYRYYLKLLIYSIKFISFSISLDMNFNEFLIVTADIFRYC